MLKIVYLVIFVQIIACFIPGLNTNIIVQDEIPVPSRVGEICDNKMRTADEMAECYAIGDPDNKNNNYYNPDNYDRDESLKERIQEILKTGENEHKVCCDFWQYFSCYQKHSPNVCTPEGVIAMNEFFYNMVKYLEKNKCPAIKWDTCAHRESDSNPKIDAQILSKAFAKLQNNREYSACLNTTNLSRDSPIPRVMNNYQATAQESDGLRYYCCTEYSTIQCNRKFADKVCSPVEVLALKRFDDKYVEKLEFESCKQYPFERFTQFCTKKVI